MIARHIITLIKRDGERHSAIPADVQPDIIFIDDVTVPVEEGDLIERKLPNGLLETFVVVDRGFWDDHYQVKVRRQNRTSKPTSIVYNLHGPNTRINIDSHDASVNVVNIQADNLFSELRSAIQQIQSDDRKALLAKLDALEKAEGNKLTFAQKYAEFMSSAANHATILSPFFPALAQLFT